MAVPLSDTAARRTPGDLVRHWRAQRHLTQQELAIQCRISARHLSFIETGRSKPTSAMVLKICEELDVPLRDRNDILMAAGHAPAYTESTLDQPSMASIGQALIQILDGHMPYPAVVVDRQWNMVDANTAIDKLIAGSAPELLEPPVNVLRLSLHPQGVAPRIRNLSQWRAHLFSRLDHQIRATGDPELVRLREELRGYPGGIDPAPKHSLVIPLRIDTGSGVLSFFSATTVFGTPMDVTVAELAIESFFPADPETAAALAA
ncbi:helix-turn-helix domain-containing protein [Glycomyces algeriensis]|uniref:Transcriptional regulator n=1 Tax=Glycomyces algeriensis TaxID=256037 RepID=A0A9W6LHV1_9ACTN|nr:helix-turn-helix transcriptional regulator [Glycomyces algeriensis]MDA1366802.1 helix-turn-helix transcriptional regulator [Glycomyces algeriensis]MDA1368653.1 helix-turn-helix transcriptional regulator [Glycomyces algeriensis]MDR7351689.1 transcriptional regulator with XRE-family HTH domain [Glycomyces algeriensis]GLI44412.1 transcriptional regulator [Glycomyces algeriensis]